MASFADVNPNRPGPFGYGHPPAVCTGHMDGQIRRCLSARGITRPMPAIRAARTPVFASVCQGSFRIHAIFENIRINIFSICFYYIFYAAIIRPADR